VNSTYSQINSLSETLFIAGNEITLEFAVYDEGNQPVNLLSTQCSWAMCQIGDPNHAVLTKDGTINAEDEHKFTVKLTSSETLNLSGRYLHQPIVVDLNGSVFRPAQGHIIVVPAIKE
jgi:hypothetical protein